MLTIIAGAIALIPGGGAVFGAAASAAGYLLRCTTCLKALGVAALVGWTALHVHHADAARCAARIEVDHKKAAAAAEQRDVDVRTGLETKYRPEISRLEQHANKLQQEVARYETRKPDPKLGAAVRSCPLGNGPLQLRKPAG
jgi:hypothetical protein